MAKTLPTIKIVWTGEPGWLNINQSAFDPSTHQEYGTTVEVEAVETESPTEKPRSERETELMTLYYGESGDEANWRPIKAIADKYGIVKPDAGWDEAIPLILEAEYGN